MPNFKVGLHISIALVSYIDHILNDIKVNVAVFTVWVYQVLVAFLWIYGIIVTVAYSANLTAFLTVERVPEGITSLKQLFESGLNVYAVSPFFVNTMKEAKNEYVKVRNCRLRR